jgi:hypothetical protein
MKDEEKDEDSISKGDWMQAAMNFTVYMEIDTEGAPDSTVSSGWVKGQANAKGSASAKITALTNIDDIDDIDEDDFDDYFSVTSNISQAFSYALAYKPASGRGGKFILNLGVSGEGNYDGFIGEPEYYGTLELYDNAGELVRTVELDEDYIEKFILIPDIEGLL